MVRYLHELSQFRIMNAFLRINPVQTSNTVFKYTYIGLLRQVLKLYAWEPSFEKKVQDVRDKEIAVIRKGAYLNAVNTFFWTSAPFVVKPLFR